MQNAWRGFHGGAWEKEVNVRDFIQLNYHPYDGDDTFLEGPTQEYLRFMGSGIRAVKTGERSRRSIGYGHKSGFNHYLPWTGIFE